MRTNLFEFCLHGKNLRGNEDIKKVENEEGRIKNRRKGEREKTKNEKRRGRRDGEVGEGQAGAREKGGVA